MKKSAKNSSKNNLETAVLGGGCFWCLETAYLKVKGVASVISGYAGGKKTSPSYEEVSRGKTGHAEVIMIKYNQTAISYEDLLNIFFGIHDPTTLNRQGNDIGTQYRSVVLYKNNRQKEMAEKIIRDLTAKKLFDKPIITEVYPLDIFYPAEQYHQNYFEKNPDRVYCRLIIAPNLAKFRQKYAKYYK